MVKKHILDVSPELWKDVKRFELENDCNNINDALVLLISAALYEPALPAIVTAPTVAPNPLPEAPKPPISQSRRRQNWSPERLARMREQMRQKL